MRKTNNYCFFYRSVLGQWHMFDFVVGDKTFCCNEQWMMWSKAMLFNDYAMASSIMKENNPKIHQSLGRMVKGYDQTIWDANKYNIVRDGNLHRFRQEESSRKVLFDTYPLELCEASPTDLVWGCGIAENDTKADNSENWTGQNLLGKALTEVRTTLMAEADAGQPK